MMSAEERKENRVLMGQAVLNAASKPPARFQQAAANVLASQNFNKPPLTYEEPQRRNTVTNP